QGEAGRGVYAAGLPRSISETGAAAAATHPPRDARRSRRPVARSTLNLLLRTSREAHVAHRQAEPAGAAHLVGHLLTGLLRAPRLERAVPLPEDARPVDRCEQPQVDAFR